METLARGHDPLILVGPFVGDGPRPEHEPRGVLVCVDQSPASKDLVADGVVWAGRVGEPLVIATVAEPVPEPVRPHPGHRRFGPDGDVDAYLTDLAAPVLSHGVDVTTHVIWDAISPADGVGHYLRACPAFLTLAGSHARTGLARLAFGSVAAGIVLHSRSPVVVTPIGGAE
jgi:nucleotide-binding universal stress UspA family protein